MALTYTSYFKGQAFGVGVAITSDALTASTGDFITIFTAYSDNPQATAWTVTNTGTAIAWTKYAETNVAGNCKVVLWAGTAGATPPGTVTVTTTAGSTTNAEKTIHVAVHTGAHATDPLPAGKIYTGTGGTDVSQSITPTASGSALWMGAADWETTNSFAAAANCTMDATPYNHPGGMTSVPVRPTTQPRTDANAFSIGETDTAGTIAWLAFEVQAAVTAITPTIAWLRA